MARPTKQGIDYFPVDCQFDEKIEMYLIEKGAVGLAVMVTIWQMIYVNEGYYIVNNNDLHLLVKRKIDVDVNEVSDCINVCLRRNIFNQEMHEKYGILTSKAIQKRYFDAAKKKKSVAVFINYIINGIDYGNNWVIDRGNATNVNVKEEVKEKEKETHSASTDADAVSVENHDQQKPPKKNGTQRFIKPTKPDIARYCRENNYDVDAIQFFNYYESNGWRVGRNPMKDWKAAVRTWARKAANA